MQIDNELKDKLNKIIESKIFKFLKVVFWVVYFGAVLFFVEVFITSCYLLGTGSFIYRIMLLFINISPWEMVLIIPQMVFLFIILPFTLSIDIAIIIRKYFFKKTIPFHWKVVFYLNILFISGAIYMRFFLNFSCR